MAYYNFVTLEKDSVYPFQFHQTSEQAETQKTFQLKEHGRELKVITCEQYDFEERARLLTPVSATTKENYWDMLEILPPENYERDCGMVRFNMSEYQTGTYSTQFAELHGYYLEKMVDVSDRNTWITHADFVDVFHSEEKKCSSIG